MTKKTISLCMIVKNEEQHLPRVLESVKEQVDEVIIVDTGSTDRTVEIARQYQAKVHSFVWIHDFAAARNESLRHATCDYILVLDADEYLDEEADLRRDVASGHDAYLLRIKNYVSGAPAVYHPAVRLFKNGIGLKYAGKIHEHLNLDDGDFSQAVGQSLIHHTGYQNEVMQDRNKVERNLKILLQEVEENPTGYNLYNLGTQYRVMKQYDKAFDCLKRAFHLSKDRAYVMNLLFQMGDTLRELKRFEDGIRLMRDAIDSFPGNTDLYFQLAWLYEEAGYVYDAEQYYQKCLQLGEVEFVQSMEGVGSFLSHYKLAEGYLQQGRMMQALEQVVQALRLRPHFKPALAFYLRLLRQVNIGHADVREHLEKVYPLQTAEDVTVLLGVLYAVRHPLLETYVQAFNVETDAKLKAVAKQYAGQYEAARDAWREVGEVTPTEAADVVVLALLLEDAELLGRAKSGLNLNKREWQALQRLLEGTLQKAERYSTDLERLLLEVCNALMVLQEFDWFESVTAVLLQGSKKARFELAQNLIKHGYLTVAQDVLLALLQEDPAFVEGYALLGDLALRTQQYQDALTLYLRALELRKSYSEFARMYHLYEVLQDQEGMRKVRQEMKRQFPSSEWAAV
jgi:glycosyltransferase involved in cell wall biosynthesis